MYRVTYKDDRPPLNVDCDHVQCGPGHLEFLKRNAEGKFEVVMTMETAGVKNYDQVEDSIH